MRLLQVFKDFAAGTSIVGLKYLVQPQLSVVARVFWAFMIMFAMIFAGTELNKTVACKFLLLFRLKYNFSFTLIWVSPDLKKLLHAFFTF